MYKIPLFNTIICLMLMSFGCRPSPDLPIDTPSTAQNREANYISVQHVDFRGLRTEEIPAHRTIFRTAQEWQYFWKKYSNRAAPTINFEQKHVAAIFLGPKPNPGYQVRIDRARVVGSKNLILILHRIVPDKDANYIDVETYPADMVSFNELYDSIEWDETIIKR